MAISFDATRETYPGWIALRIQEDHICELALPQAGPRVNETQNPLAKQLGAGARAIGGARRGNPVLLLIPCHRVVAAHGGGGFAGHDTGRWVDIKRRLLQLEANG